MTTDLAVETAVRQLYARVVDAVWRKDAGGFAECFTREGEWRIAGLVFRGRGEIEQGLGRFVDGSRRVLMMFGTPLLDGSGSELSARTPVTEFSAPKDGPAFRTLAIYYERFAEEDGRLRFAWRHFELHYAGAVDLSNEIFSHADRGAPPALPALDAPTFGSAELRARRG